MAIASILILIFRRIAVRFNYSAEFLEMALKWMIAGTEVGPLPYSEVGSCGIGPSSPPPTLLSSSVRVPMAEAAD